jgi:hypothetical protein
MNNLVLFAQTSTSSADTNPVETIFWIIVLVIIFASLWRIFTKASKPGWAAIIPFYNIYIQLKIINRPGWWLILYFIPIVNFVIGLIIAVDIARAFGKSSAFGVFGLFIFSFIGYPMLAFGDAKYQGSPQR